MTGCVLENAQTGSLDQSKDYNNCDETNQEVSEDNIVIKNKVKKRRSKKFKNKMHEESNGNDVIDEDYLKFAMETAKHRKERDTKGQDKFNLTVDDDENTDYCKNAAENIAVDHERLKKEMKELFGRDALKVNLFLRLIYLENKVRWFIMILSTSLKNPTFVVLMY